MRGEDNEGAEMWAFMMAEKCSPVLARQNDIATFSAPTDVFFSFFFNF